MSEVLCSVLVEAIDDEYKSRATYLSVIRKFGDVRPFTNIAEAEGRHIEALISLFKKYGFPVPEDTWASRIKTPQTLMEACRAGVKDEIENAEMYDRLLASTKEYPDVQKVLMRLQRASVENHLTAFQRCVERGAESGQGRGRRYGQHVN